MELGDWMVRFALIRRLPSDCLDSGRISPPMTIKMVQRLTSDSLWRSFSSTDAVVGLRDDGRLRSANGFLNDDVDFRI